MDYIKPNNTGFTVYTKSGCRYCDLVKKLLNDHKFNFFIVNCDNYILENKSVFLAFLSNVSQQNINTFPVVFNGTNYIGGYNETNKYIQEINAFFELNDF